MSHFATKTFRIRVAVWLVWFLVILASLGQSGTDMPTSPAAPLLGVVVHDVTQSGALFPWLTASRWKNWALHKYRTRRSAHQRAKRTAQMASLSPYQIADWIGQTVLVSVLGMPASKFNDDRLGRTLGALYPHLNAIWGDIVAVALHKTDVDLSVIFYASMPECATPVCGSSLMSPSIPPSPVRSISAGDACKRRWKRPSVSMVATCWSPMTGRSLPRRCFDSTARRMAWRSAFGFARTIYRCRPSTFTRTNVSLPCSLST